MLATSGTGFAGGRFTPVQAPLHLLNANWPDSVERDFGFESKAFGGGMDYIKSSRL